MNRIDRISAILIQLQSRRTVKAQDVATRFNISLRTVYRDIKTLEEAGIPLIGEAGVGYSIVDGYRLPPVMFTRDEAAAFLTAEKMVGKLTDAANGASYSSAMYKIRSVLKSTDKDYLESLENNIEVLKARSGENQTPAVQNQLQTILQAIAHKKVLALCYRAAYKEENTKRHIEPVGVFYLDNYWHLIAWCRMRQGYRDFRFDRMEGLTTADELFETTHPPLKEHLKRLYKENDLQSVVVRIKKEVVPYLGEQKFYHGFVSEIVDGEYIEMSFMTPSLIGFSRWYIVYADYAKIIEPDELKVMIKNTVKNILENL